MRKTSVLAAIFFMAAFANPLSAQSQREQTLLGDRGFRLTGFWANWNHQLAPFDNQYGYIRGWQFGLEFGKAIFLGYGRNRLDEPVTLADGRRLEFNYNAFKIGYGITPWRAIHPIVQIDFGPGRTRIDNESRRNNFVIQPAAGLELNVFRWLRLDMEGGYRFVRNSGTAMALVSDRELSGPYAQATARFGLSWGKHHTAPKYARKKPAEQ
ncbi:MAG: hypothetical protein ACK4NS_00725 [Saprospiraceae bacterium]